MKERARFDKLGLYHAKTWATGVYSIVLRTVDVSEKLRYIVAVSQEVYHI